MYRTIDDFVLDWENESTATMKVLRALTDGSLKQKVTPEGRSLGFLAWHLVLTLSEMGSKMGVQVTAPAEDSEPPTVAAEIASNIRYLVQVPARSRAPVLDRCFTQRRDFDVRRDVEARRGSLVAGPSPNAPSGADDCPYASGGAEGPRRLRTLERRVDSDGDAGTQVT